MQTSASARGRLKQVSDELFPGSGSTHQTDLSRRGLRDLEGEKACTTTSPSGRSNGSYSGVSQYKRSSVQSRSASAVTMGPSSPGRVPVSSESRGAAQCRVVAFQESPAAPCFPGLHCLVLLHRYHWECKAIPKAELYQSDEEQVNKYQLVAAFPALEPGRQERANRPRSELKNSRGAGQVHSNGNTKPTSKRKSGLRFYHWTMILVARTHQPRI